MSLGYKGKGGITDDLGEVTERIKAPDTERLRDTGGRPGLLGADHELRVDYTGFE